MFQRSQNFCKFSAFSLEFQKFSQSLEQFFLTVGQNNFDNKTPLCIPPLHKHTVLITEKSFICDICGKGFTKKNILRGHLRRHMEKLTPDAEKKDLICELCGYTTKIMKNFKRHKQSKHETEKHHQCPYCEFHHHVIGCLHIHIDSKHPEHDKKQFFCDHCSRSFIFKISLKKHHENLRTIARLREKNLREKGIIH